jgi:hypothetical protein
MGEQSHFDRREQRAGFLKGKRNIRHALGLHAEREIFLSHVSSPNLNASGAAN